MALFSQRTNSDDQDGNDAGVKTSPETAGDSAPPEPEAAASVGISVSAYRGLGAESASTPAATGGAVAGSTTPTETVPGIRDNVVLREALATLPARPSPEEILGVARQLLQGHLFLRVQGDARALLAQKKNLPIGIASMNGKQYVLAFSSGEALRASITRDAGAGTSAMGQPVQSVLRYVLSGTYAGIILDSASAPARAVIPRELLEKLSDQADPTFELKTLLSSVRTDNTATQVGWALSRVKFWVAAGKSSDGRFGVAEVRTADGARLIELYSHPLEVASLRRGDRAAPMTAGQLAAALKSDIELGGVLVDSGGPSIRLSRADLAPILALPTDAIS